MFDRFSGYEEPARGRPRAAATRVGVVEHFWCASYAPLLRTCCDRLVLDLHNIESELARTHARAARWPASWASDASRNAYQRLEREWLPQFDVILTASEDDRRRIDHPDVRVFPNALPEIARPHVPEANCDRLQRQSRIPSQCRSRALVPLANLAARSREVLRESSGAWSDTIRKPSRASPAAIRASAWWGRWRTRSRKSREAKVCVVPLLSGSGTRFKILEAWAAGRAVVSTTLGAEGLGARDGEHLLLADDPDDFADAVLRLWNDPALRKRLGDAGWAHYRERFTWPAAWRKLDESGGI